MNDASPPMEGTPLIAPSSTDHPLYDQVVEAFRTVYDPEIPVNIYDLGLVYTVEINDENDVRIVDYPEGFQLVCIGSTPQRRQMLDAAYGFLMLRNGVLIGYVLSASLFGSSGRDLWRLSRGIDDRPVTDGIDDSALPPPTPEIPVSMPSTSPSAPSIRGELDTGCGAGAVSGARPAPP